MKSLRQFGHFAFVSWEWHLSQTECPCEHWKIRPGNISKQTGHCSDAASAPCQNILFIRVNASVTKKKLLPNSIRPFYLFQEKAKWGSETIEADLVNLFFRCNGEMMQSRWKCWHMCVGMFSVALIVDSMTVNKLLLDVSELVAETYLFETSIFSHCQVNIFWRFRSRSLWRNP